MGRRGEKHGPWTERWSDGSGDSQGSTKASREALGETPACYDIDRVNEQRRLIFQKIALSSQDRDGAGGAALGENDKAQRQVLSSYDPVTYMTTLIMAASSSSQAKDGNSTIKHVNSCMQDQSIYSNQSIG